MNERIGELLVRQNMLTAEQLKRARDEARTNGARLGHQITKLGYLQETELTEFVAKQYGLPSIELAEFEIDHEVIKLIPEEVAIKHTVIPVNRAGSTLILATADPSNIFAIDDIKFLTGYNVEVVVSSEEAIKAAIDKYYDKSASFADVMSDLDVEDLELVQDEDDVDVGELARESEDAPVVKLVNLILTDAVKRSASDIHIEPYEKEFRVRYRIDGMLYEVMKPPMKLRNAITSRLKIMAELDIAERRLPQDGRIKLKMGRGKEMDFRVSTLPTLFGEKVVLRLLDKSNLQLDMTKLGFEQQQLDVFKDCIHRPFGMVLVTGPTGSGKTTTLYSALAELNKISENISTAEDPVEFNLSGINQVQMHEDIGLELRRGAALVPAPGPRHHHGRRDPRLRDRRDRDQGGAHRPPRALDAAHQRRPEHREPAAQHGHRAVPGGVVGELHPRPAPRAPGLRGVQGTRDRTSPNRRCSTRASAKRRSPTRRCSSGRGCRTCSETGYKGRVAVYEVMELTEELKEFVLNGASSMELKREAIRGGMMTLRRSALNKLVQGTTTLSEVLRVSSSDTRSLDPWRISTNC